eukprot:COSAG03_NODE_124_length_12185_cov_3.572977_1_plen_49_part_10
MTPLAQSDFSPFVPRVCHTDVGVARCAVSTVGDLKDEATASVSAARACD